MAQAAHNVAIEEVSGIAYGQHTIVLTFVFIVSHGIHMHGEAFRPHLDFPFVAHVGGKVVERGELLQVLVPPVDDVVFLIDVFTSHLGFAVAVIVGVAAHDDFRTLGADGRVAHAFQMLVGDTAVVKLDFVVPFGRKREGGRNVVGVGDTLPIEAVAKEIQMVVKSFCENPVFIAWGWFRQWKILNGVVEMLAVVEGISQDRCVVRGYVALVNDCIVRQSETACAN